MADPPILVRIEGTDLPGARCGPGPDRPGGHHGIEVGVQHRDRTRPVLGPTPGDAASATWVLECRVGGGTHAPDIKGPHVQGPPGGRFIYLSWSSADDEGVPTMFRRAKLRLDAVPDEVLHAAVGAGLLVGRLGLTDDKGNPRCASVSPPVITWSAGHRS